MERVSNAHTPPQAVQESVATPSSTASAVLLMDGWRYVLIQFVAVRSRFMACLQHHRTRHQSACARTKMQPSCMPLAAPHALPFVGCALAGGISFRIAVRYPSSFPPCVPCRKGCPCVCCVFIHRMAGAAAPPPTKLLLSPIFPTRATTKTPFC